MKVSDLTPQQLNTMLNDLQALVDGWFTNTDEIVVHTGVKQEHAVAILDSIELLKSLTLEQDVSEQKIEKTVRITGVDGVRLVKINRQWKIQDQSPTGEWVYAGDTYETMDDAYDAAAEIFEF